VSYLLGKCYINTGEIQIAEARFTSAIQLDPNEYASVIGDEFMQSGFSFIKANKHDLASNLLYKAIEYQPKLKTTIIQELLASGQTTLKIGQFEMTYETFSLAYKMNSASGGDISDIYYNYALTGLRPELPSGYIDH